MADITRISAAAMNDAEWEIFASALVKLKTKIVNPTAPPWEHFSVYDQFVALHTAVLAVRTPGGGTTNMGHQSAGFYRRVPDADHDHAGRKVCQRSNRQRVLCRHPSDARNHRRFADLLLGGGMEFSPESHAQLPGNTHSADPDKSVPWSLDRASSF